MNIIIGCLYITILECNLASLGIMIAILHVYTCIAIIIIHVCTCRQCDLFRGWGALGFPKLSFPSNGPWNSGNSYTKLWQYT